MLNPEHKEIITDYFSKHLSLTKEEKTLLEEGSYSEYIYFVIKGCLRMYFVDDKIKTHILQFAPENWWIYDINSFNKKSASRLNIDALEDTEVLKIDFENFNKLCCKELRFSCVFRKLQENTTAVL